MQLHEVGDVLRHERSPLGRRQGQEVGIGKAVHFGAFASGHGVMTAIPQLASDLRREVLVQHEPHRRIARSRFVAACSLSATAVCRAMSSSISPGKAAA